MKIPFLFCFVLISNICLSQVFEYTNLLDVNFIEFDNSNNILNKITNEKDFNMLTPENVVQYYYFAKDNNMLKNLYLNSESAVLRDEKHYAAIEKTKYENVKIILLHKMTFKVHEDEMCYIMFIVKIKDVDFTFPTLLTLKKVDEKWRIHRLSNQNYMTEPLFWFKSCVLLKLIDGNRTNYEEFNHLLLETKTNNYLDFEKLNDKFFKEWNNSDEKSIKYTLAKDNNCPFKDVQPQASNKIVFNLIYKNVEITDYEQKFIEQDKNLIRLLKIDNDSIVLKGKIKIGINNPILLIKYTKISINGGEKLVLKRLDNTKIEDNPTLDLLFLFERLKTSIFKDLSPKLNGNESKTELYIKTRGNYNILNITKLKDIFDNKNELLIKYNEKD